MPITTRSFRPDDRARLQECEMALLRLREQIAKIREHSDGAPTDLNGACQQLEAIAIYTQGAEEILGNTLGDEPSP